MAEFRMPSLGADMDVGTILQWLVKPGDHVNRGDIVAVVDTEKATIEIEVFQSGVIEKLIVPEGQEVPVGTLIAMIHADGEAAAPAPEAKPSPPPVAAAPRAVPLSPAPAVPRPVPTPIPRPVERPPAPRPAAAPHRLRVSPLAMRVALDLKVDLSTVSGSGPDGAITRADVERAAKAAAQPRVTPAPVPKVSAPKPAAATGKPGAAPIDHHVAMRRVIAASMARSKREIPHYYLAIQIDMSRALAWLQAENLKRPVTDRILYAVLLLKAVARALGDFPEMNGYWVDNAFRHSEAIHVGVAISLRKGGLIAPAIHDVDKKTLTEVMAGLRDLVKRVRAETLRSSEIADATITVTSLGEQGVETVFGIIYPPQVALVGFGKIVERPWAANGMVGARPTIMATLSADHRASDGHRGGLFLAAIDRFLQEPEKL
jgi:pyruvate dehydrogenase E2 component (dihydrolipoamide acetyltransferase)